MPKNVWGTTLSTSFHGSTDYPIFSPGGGFYLRHIVETISWSSSGLDVSTASKYGLTIINMAGTDPSTSPATLTLAAPVAGCEKYICLQSTGAYINSIDIDLGSGVRVQGASDSRYIAFSSLAADYQGIALMGISTAKWIVKGVDSTLGGFGAATGIRASTAARTS
jgi:hypothetical protein